MAKTGIFWFYRGELIAKACDRNNSVMSVSGLLDSPDNHTDYWDKTLQHSLRFPEFSTMEYFQVPRGRVLLTKYGKKAVVYLDGTLMINNYKNLIRQGFQLENMAISWRRDMHYTTDRGELDDIFNE